MPRKAMVNLTESMFYVLMAFQSEPMCGTDVMEYIKKKSHARVNIGPATLYTIIGKFEQEKYIKEKAVDGRKRTYAITIRGLDAYEAELCRLRQCLSDAEGASVCE